MSSKLRRRAEWEFRAGSKLAGDNPIRIGPIATPGGMGKDGTNAAAGASAASATSTGSAGSASVERCICWRAPPVLGLLIKKASPRIRVIADLWYYFVQIENRE